MRSIKYRRPTARNQKQQIKSNQRQIVSVKRQLSLTKQRCRWQCGFTEIPVTAFPMVIPLTSGPSTSNVATTNTGQPVGWTTTMTDRPQDTPFLRNKAVINTQWVDLSITGGNEPSPLYFTAFLVQLQEDTATQTYVETSKMQTLVKDTDYCCPNNVGSTLNSGYGAYMNSARYKILKRMEFCTLGPTIGWPGGPPGTGGTDSGLGAAVRRHQFKINYGNTTLKSAGSGAQLQTMPYDEIDPKHKRFLVLFSDNSLLDSQFPNVAVSSLITGYSAE